MVSVYPDNQIELARADYDEMYGRPLPPAWEIGRPQPAVVAWCRQGLLAGHVLDVGCGCGRNAIHMAQAGLTVTGIDFSRPAIQAATRLAGQTETGRGSVRFVEADVLDYRPGEQYDTVVDSALCHCLNPRQRLRYLAGLHDLCTRGASLHMLTLSDRVPARLPGPFRISEDVLRDTLTQAGWDTFFQRLTFFQTAWTADRMKSYVRELGLVGPDFGELIYTADGEVMLPLWETHARHA
jgi:SAM-dependent methyltransferase